MSAQARAVGVAEQEQRAHVHIRFQRARLNAAVHLGKLRGFESER